MRAQMGTSRKTLLKDAEEAADLVTARGGSLSGEHGDGQARAELLPRMYPPELIDAFAEFKACWDPEDRMNPGTIVRPRRLDADLRVFVDGPRPAGRPQLALAHDHGSLEAATRRCVGVGACLSASGGVMCPSFRATGEEMHSTRGREQCQELVAVGTGLAGRPASVETLQETGVLDDTRTIQDLVRGVVEADRAQHGPA